MNSETWNLEKSPELDETLNFAKTEIVRLLKKLDTVYKSDNLSMKKMKKTNWIYIIETEEFVVNFINNEKTWDMAICYTPKNRKTPTDIIPTPN